MESDSGATLQEADFSGSNYLDDGVLQSRACPNYKRFESRFTKAPKSSCKQANRCKDMISHTLHFRCRRCARTRITLSSLAFVKSDVTIRHQRPTTVNLPQNGQPAPCIQSQEGYQPAKNHHSAILKDRPALSIPPSPPSLPLCSLSLRSKPGGGAQARATIEALLTARADPCKAGEQEIFVEFRAGGL